MDAVQSTGDTSSGTSGKKPRPQQMRQRMPGIEDIQPRGKRNIVTKLKFSEEFLHQQQPSKRAKKSTKDVTCKKNKSSATSKITSLDIKISKPDTTKSKSKEEFSLQQQSSQIANSLSPSNDLLAKIEGILLSKFGIGTQSQAQTSAPVSASAPASVSLSPLDQLVNILQHNIQAPIPAPASAPVPVLAPAPVPASALTALATLNPTQLDQLCRAISAQQVAPIASTTTGPIVHMPQSHSHAQFSQRQPESIGEMMEHLQRLEAQMLAHAQLQQQFLFEAQHMYHAPQQSQMLMPYSAPRNNRRRVETSPISYQIIIPGAPRSNPFSLDSSNSFEH